MATDYQTRNKILVLHRDEAGTASSANWRADVVTVPDGGVATIAAVAGGPFATLDDARNAARLAEGTYGPQNQYPSAALTFSEEVVFDERHHSGSDIPVAQ